MIAVVTGSSGFIGSHLVDALLQRGATVRALVRPESAPADRDERVATFTADLLDDRSVRQSPIWDGATHVFHLAGVTKGRLASQFSDGNVVPTANILAALAAQSATLQRFVLVSSQAAAGPAGSGDRPVTENDEPRPIEGYGRSKLEAEQIARRNLSQIPVTVVRPAAVYGPRDRDFAAAFRQASGRFALYAAPRDQQFSIVHVADLVRALVVAAESPAAEGQTYFVGDETPVTWRELYRLVAAQAGAAPREIQIPLPALRIAAAAADLLGALTGRAGLLNSNKVALARSPWWLCDATRARVELGWCPHESLQAGIRETYLWYVEHGWLRPPKHQQSESTVRAPKA